MIIPATKEKIFDKSLELMTIKTYESVSMRDIADAVGIQAASIYNHYGSKTEILDHFYEYYTERNMLGRPSVEEMLATIQEGSLQDIVDGYTANSFSHLEGIAGARMMLITKLIYTRKFHDEKAAEIYLNNSATSKEYIRATLQHGIDLGRFHSLDTEYFSTTFVALYEDLGIKAFISPEYKPEAPEGAEGKIKQWMLKLLEDYEIKGYGK